MYHTVGRFIDRVSYDADASVGCVSQDPDKLDRAADELRELNSFKREMYATHSLNLETTSCATGQGILIPRSLTVVLVSKSFFQTVLLCHSMGSNFLNCTT